MYYIELVALSIKKGELHDWLPTGQWITLRRWPDRSHVLPCSLRVTFGCRSTAMWALVHTLTQYLLPKLHSSLKQTSYIHTNIHTTKLKLRCVAHTDYTYIYKSHTSASSLLAVVSCLTQNRLPRPAAAAADATCQTTPCISLRPNTHWLE